ncbi:MAG: long-chain fatty acid--CoA ligase [Chloroflexota bacterium]
MISRRTITHLNHEQLSKNPSADASYYPNNGGFKAISKGDLKQAYEEIGAGLWSLGLRKGDRAAVMSQSRLEWDMADGGALAMGMVVVAIYPTAKEEDVSYILNHSGSQAAFLEDASHWAKVAPELEKLPDLQHVIMIDPTDMPSGDWVSLDQLREEGRKTLADNPTLVDEAREAVQTEDLAGLVYTSGTTGLPKGVALAHSNLFAVAEIINNFNILNDGDTGVVYLPMSHILQRVNMYYGRMAGIVGYFAPSMLDLVPTCQAAHPRSVSGVPRVWEKIHARIMAQVAQAPAGRQRLFHTAVNAGLQKVKATSEGKPVPLAVNIQCWIFERVVFRKLRAAIFGENIEFLTSGAAPISTELIEFFAAIGIPIYEGYGLTETSSPITLNLPGAMKIGSVGPIFPDAEAKIAEDGEILLKGTGVFSGYYNNPEANAEAFTEDGWFKSGDIGHVDDDGYLFITDRKKYLIITAAGKNIPPAPIEQKLMQHPMIGQVVVHGDARNYLTALFTIDPEGAQVWAEQQGKAEAGTPVDMASFIADSDVQNELQSFVDGVNDGLASFETVKYFRVLPEEFSVENGLLTPSMKVKRKTVETEFVGLLDEMYV